MDLSDVAAGILAVIGLIILAFFLAGIAAVIVMLLWNWLMPGLFSLRTINFWEAWALTWLCHILFKSSSTTKKN